MNEIVCIVDGFDCVVLGSSDEMLNKYNSLKTNKIIFSANKDNNFLKLIFGKTKQNKNEYNRINSGCYIGPIYKIIKLLNKMYNKMTINKKMNDQELLTFYYNNCMNLLDLDCNRILFYNLELDNSFYYQLLLLIYNKNHILKAPIENSNYKFSNNRIILNNNSKPVILHINGLTNINDIIIKLKLPLQKKNDNYFEYLTKKLIIKIREKKKFFFKFMCHFISTIHLLISILLLLYPFFTNNIKYLLIYLFIWFIMLTHWVIIGKCSLTDLENMFCNNNCKKDESDNQFKKPLLKYFDENTLFFIFTTTPLIFISYALYKIYKLKINNIYI
jgi:hypothetical protein